MFSPMHHDFITPEIIKFDLFGEAIELSHTYNLARSVEKNT